MLTIRFHPEKRNEEGEVEVDPPYEIIAHYLESDIQHDPASARSVIALLRSVLSGEKDSIVADGNAYVVEAKGTMAHISNEYSESISLDLPIEWLIGALEKWIAFLEAKS
jgi:hypothetical protein